MGVFEIHGSAQRDVNYDVAVILIEFVASEKTGFEASAKVMKDCEAFLAEIEKYGIDASAFTLVEDSVSDENSYRDNDDVSATRSIQLKMPFDMKKINGIRGLLDSEKYDSRFELEFELTNEDEIYGELLKEALLDSKKKAILLAETLGQEVKGIESVDTYTHSRSKRSSMDWMECECEMAYPCEQSFSKSNSLNSKEETLSESIEVKWIIE